MTGCLRLVWDERSGPRSRLKICATHCSSSSGSAVTTARVTRDRYLTCFLSDRPVLAGLEGFHCPVGRAWRARFSIPVSLSLLAPSPHHRSRRCPSTRMQVGGAAISTSTSLSLPGSPHLPSPASSRLQWLIRPRSRALGGWTVHSYLHPVAPGLLQTC